MSDAIIRCAHLCKKYVIGRRRTEPVTLRDTLARQWRRLWPGRLGRRPGPGGPAVDDCLDDGATTKDFWALDDVSFEIKRGEVVGIVGRNGAGKSTLLKILSRITNPTSGRITLAGRVASLLEVGTGFHPELTGRENIFLNGALLGMSKAEIKRKFDEIVAFSEIEEFLDTPVKRYSSGMYVRLAFGVAAHLEPEILIVDEVLAVGDFAFQRKCLGKMSNIPRQGRTVLFVSHNMPAVISLCDRCLLLDKGKLVLDGETRQVAAHYESRVVQRPSRIDDLRDAPRYGSGKARFTSVRIYAGGPDGRVSERIVSGQDLCVELDLLGHRDMQEANVAIIIYGSMGERLIDVNTALRDRYLSLDAGQRARVTFRLHNVLLKPGNYELGLWLGRANHEDIDGITHVASLTIEPNTAVNSKSVLFPGYYQCDFTSTIEIGRPHGATAA